MTMAAMPILRPGIAALLLLLCFGAGLVVRHVDRGYVEYVEGDRVRAETILTERGMAGDAWAAFVAGGLVAARRSSAGDFCTARFLWRRAGDGGVAEARSAYVGITAEINRDAATCRWANRSLERLLGQHPEHAAEIRGFLARSPICGPDAHTAYIWFRAAEIAGSAHAGDAVDALAGETGLTRPGTEAAAMKLLPSVATDPDWPSILAAEPPGSCPGR